MSKIEVLDSINSIYPRLENCLLIIRGRLKNIENHQLAADRELLDELNGVALGANLMECILQELIEIGKNE